MPSRFEAVLHLVPEHRLAEALLDQRVEFGAVVHAGPPRGVGHVLVDRQRQAHRQRKNHADAPPQLRRRCACGTRPRRRRVPGRTRRRRGTKSIVRLMHFSSVVLPELAGPMMPKISRSGMSSETSASASCAVADADVVESRYEGQSAATISFATGSTPAGRSQRC